MSRNELTATVVGLTVPLIVLGNSLLILLVPWTADGIYLLPGFPADPLGLEGRDRADLAETGIRSIWPFGEGTGLLTEARLPDGTAAFEPKEVRHMDDVRGLVRTGLLAWLLALVAGIASALKLRRRDRAALVPALGRGAHLTLIVMGIAGLVMLVAFEFFFDGFHAIFFEGDSWKFADEFTLRRIYPDAFWGVAFGLFAAIALAQALVLSRFTTGLPRFRRRSRQERQ